MVDIGSWRPVDINNSGTIVGFSNATGPLVWDSVNGLSPIQPLLDNTANGWTLETAVGINDAGQIVGWGTNPDGFDEGFVLNVSAIPLPRPLALRLRPAWSCWDSKKESARLIPKED